MGTGATETNYNDKQMDIISVKRIQYLDRRRHDLDMDGRIERRETDIPDKRIKTLPTDITNSDHCKSVNYEMDVSGEDYYYIMHIPLGICIIQVGAHKYLDPVWEHSYFLVTKEVEKHFDNDHKQEIEPSSHISILHKRFLSYVRPRSVVEHLRAHMPEKQFQCFHCEKSFFDLHILIVHQQSHMIQHQSVYSPKPYMPNQYQCSYCKKFFDKQNHFFRHVKTHASDKIIEFTYPCSHCDRSFHKTRNLLEHQRTHTGEKSYTCRKCDNHFVYKLNFLKHQDLHLGMKPYQCSNCDECFSHISYLVYHQRIHIKEKPYQCKYCDKCFGRPITLKCHQKLHIEGKHPFL